MKLEWSDLRFRALKGIELSFLWVPVFLLVYINQNQYLNKNLYLPVARTAGYSDVDRRISQTFRGKPNHCFWNARTKQNGSQQATHEEIRSIAGRTKSKLGGMMAKHRVLFVDDEENILISLQRLFLKDDDIEILTATAPESAIPVLNTVEVDLVVSDEKMPRYSGSQFIN